MDTKVVAMKPRWNPEDGAPSARMVREMADEDLWTYRDSGLPGAFDAAVAEVCRRWAAYAYRGAHAAHAKKGWPASFLQAAISGANEGLFRAARVFDPARGVQWNTYLHYRIDGNILDATREGSEFPRTVLPVVRFVDSYEAEHGFSPSLREVQEAVAEYGPDNVADKLRYIYAQRRSLSLDEMQEKRDGEGAGRVSGVHFLPAPAEYGPENTFLDAETRAEVERAVAAIENKRIRYVVQSKLFFGIPHGQIGAVLGVSESRSCQMFSQGMAKVRKYCRQYGIEDSLKRAYREKSYAVVKHN